MVNLYRDSVRLKDYNNSAFYILLGPDENNREIYIGQTSDIGRRLYEHKLYKSFWTECLFFIYDDYNFTKTDVLWLEEHAIKKFIDCGYFQNIQNYQIPQNVVINQADAGRLDKCGMYIELMLCIYGRINIGPAKNMEYSKDNISGQKIIDRIAKSYAEYVDEAMLQACDYEDDEYGICKLNGAKYMEIGNGKVIIFKGSMANGIIPRKYKDKVKDGYLTEDIVVTNLIKAKDIIG
ncbi:MAG: hypothetical protein [Wendovervirus sonii]|uniref:GIY-YIG domain-containing protein n=1 Tax=phage Lak_Megaphage_Sonny TaxID=3109229 RepID=A0ABZ0Z751_9CAUD|nr:MAG: hypothetical protein [phage Lak_Megaphage_Sonny]